jgi:hypothetical protein
MPLDFPNSPTTGDLFNGAGVTWRWDGVKWTSVLSSGGPFLPLAGGTVTGLLTAGGGLTVKGRVNLYNDVPTVWAGNSQSPAMAPFFTNTVFSGTSTSAAGIWFHQFAITDGIISTPPFQAHNCVNSHITTAVGMVGVPQAVSGIVEQGARSGMKAAGSDYTAVAGIFSNYAFYNEGGTSPAANTGSVFGLNPDVMLRPGATFFSQLTGMEINVSASAGSSVFAKWGITIVKKSEDAVQGFGGVDAGISFADQPGTTGHWHYGIMFGNEGGHPFMEGGTAIATRMLAGGQRQSLKWDLDFINNTTTQGAFRAPGITIDNLGRIMIGAGLLSQYSTGFEIDVIGRLATSATVNTPGTGYATGNISDTVGNIWNITASGGAVTAATIVQAVPMLSPPATLALPGGGYGTGSGAVLNVTYSSLNTLVLQPSGGPIVSGGDLTLNAHTLRLGVVNSDPTVVTGGIEMYPGFGGFGVTAGTLNYNFAGTHQFMSGATPLVTMNLSGAFVAAGLALGVGGTTGPTWTTGSAVPSSTQPVGSIYSRVGGTVGATLYVSRGSGTWAAVAGV